eukprot:11228287-Lingulodinium_polyedra.AAC.3
MAKGSELLRPNWASPVADAKWGARTQGPHRCRMVVLVIVRGVLRTGLPQVLLLLQRPSVVLLLLMGTQRPPLLA